MVFRWRAYSGLVLYAYWIAKDGFIHIEGSRESSQDV